jgi:energy-coupling factor transport system ATP-binding protein
VAIAGVIALRPKCIVLDEPTAMLDPRGRREVMNTLLELCEGHGVTVVHITHYMDEAAKARRVVVMDDGRIILDAPPQEVFSHVELLRKTGLDVPQASELIHELRGEGIELPEGIITNDACVDAIEAVLRCQ